MVGILLTVLKIIGIVLLIILGIVLVLVLVLLLVPVRYRCNGEFLEEKRVYGKVWWLFSLISIPFQIDRDGVLFQIKVFGFRLGKNKSGRKKGKKKTDKRQKDGEQRNKKGENKKKAEKRHREEKSDVRKNKNNHSTKDSEKIEQIEQIEKIEQTEQKPENNHKKGSLDQSIEYSFENDLERAQGKTEENGESERIFSKLTGKINDIKEFFLKILELIKSFYEKGQDLAEKKNKIVDFFCDEEAVQGKEQTFAVGKRILRHIMPYKLSVRVKFGLEYPDQTGQLYAVLCMLYGFYGEKVCLEPDFDHQVLEGEFYLKGKIRLLNCIYYGINLYRIKKLKEFIELVKNL